MLVKDEGPEIRLVSQSQTNFVQPRDPHGYDVNVA